MSWLGSKVLSLAISYSSSCASSASQRENRRSESRAALRRHFEVDAESITIAALYQLKKQGKCDGQCVAKAVKELGIDPAKTSALYA